MDLSAEEVSTRMTSLEQCKADINILLNRGDELANEVKVILEATLEVVKAQFTVLQFVRFGLLQEMEID